MEVYPYTIRGSHFRLHSAHYRLHSEGQKLLMVVRRARLEVLGLIQNLRDLASGDS